MHRFTDCLWALGHGLWIGWVLISDIGNKRYRKNETGRACGVFILGDWELGMFV